MPFLSDTVYDVALQYIIDNADVLNLCSTVPTTYTEAITTYKLADIAVTAPDFAISNGDVSGRKVRVAAQTGIVVDADGTPVVAALTDSGNTELLMHAPCTSDLLHVGNLVNTNAFDIEILDAA